MAGTGIAELDDRRADDQDAEDVAAVLSGRVNAFAGIVKRRQGMVATIVSRHVPAQDVEEVAQEVFIRAHKSLAGWRGDQPLSHWLATISVRACHDFWRRRYRSKETAMSSLGTESRDWLERCMAPQAAEAFARETEAREAAEVLELAMGHLSASDRMVLALTHLEERSVKDTAELLGISQTNVKVRAFRARRKLRAVLEQAAKGNLP